MLRIFVLVVLIAVGGSQGGTVKRVPINHHHHRIVNGVDAQPGEFPSQVSLQYYNSHNCGASILNANWAITAAHCVDGYSTSSISLLAGTLSLDGGGTKHRAERIIVHENYNPSDSWINDIAVIKVDPPFNIDNVNVAPVKLPSQGQQTADGKTATVIGWGRIYLSDHETLLNIILPLGFPGYATDEMPVFENVFAIIFEKQGGPLSPELQKVDILTVNQQSCQDVYGGIGYDIYPGQICADVPEGNKGSCNGDSGGPLFVDGTITGLVSWANGCATPGYPTVYTRVAQYRDWVRQQTGV